VHCGKADGRDEICDCGPTLASGAPHAEIGADDHMERMPKTPRLMGRARGVTCTPGWAVRLAIWSVR